MLICYCSDNTKLNEIIINQMQHIHDFVREGNFRIHIVILEHDRRR